MANKVTKKEMFTMLLSIEDVKANSDMVDFINHEIELLDKKNGNRKPSKVQKANESLKETICTVLSELDSAVTVSDLMVDSRLSDYTNQKLSALLRQLVESGKVEKIIDKKKSLFKMV